VQNRFSDLMQTVVRRNSEKGQWDQKKSKKRKVTSAKWKTNQKVWKSAKQGTTLTPLTKKGHVTREPKAGNSVIKKNLLDGESKQKGRAAFGKLSTSCLPKHVQRKGEKSGVRIVDEGPV